MDKTRHFKSSRLVIDSLDEESGKMREFKSLSFKDIFCQKAPRDRPAFSSKELKRRIKVSVQSYHERSIEEKSSLQEE